MKIAASLALYSLLALSACTSPDSGAEPGDPGAGPGVLSPEGAPAGAGHGGATDWYIIDEKGVERPAEEVFGKRRPLAKTAWETYPAKWNKSTITYAFVDAWDTRTRNLAHSAFLGIGSVIPLEFQHIADASSADIRLRFRSEPNEIPYSGTTSSLWRNGAFERADIYLAHPNTPNYGQPFRDNHYLNLIMHEVGHAVGLGHSNVPCTMMQPYGNGSQDGIPNLCFMAPDDIAGLQSLYGPVAPKYPTWNHRYVIVAKFYIPYPPPGAPPGAQPIGWATAGLNFPLWSSLEAYRNDINKEVLKLSVNKCSPGC